MTQSNGRSPRRRGKAEKKPLVVITGMSGSGKGTVLKTLEDQGFYSVDNLPIDLIQKFADLTKDAAEIERAAIVVDVREGEALRRFPELYESLRKHLATRLIFLEASDETLIRRFSETRRPHPLGAHQSVIDSITNERERLQPIRRLSDVIIDTSKFNVHELRSLMTEKLEGERDESSILVNVISFGYRNGIPVESDLVFDVRFLPNPNYLPEFKHLTGRHPSVAAYIRSFPQTKEFISRISELLVYLLPHYVREGKSYLTISFGCTGGQHRSVLIAAEIRKRLRKAGYTVKETHRDMRRV